jgi:hypothetical protein
MRKFFLAVFLFLISAPAFAATYYIDFTAVNGDVANDGKSKNTPWQRHPYMRGWGGGGKYVHSAGDRFIFRGGVTWPSSVFPMWNPLGGSQAAHDYYGVDASWFAGAAWSRPVFDAESKPIDHFMVLQSYTMIDNIHFTNFYWEGDRGFAHETQLSFMSTDRVTVENCLFNNWTHGTYAAGTRDIMIVLHSKDATNFLIRNNLFYQSLDARKGDSTNMVVYGGSGTITSNTCFNVQNCFLPIGGVLTNNLIYNIGMDDNLQPVNDFDPAQHPNAIEILGCPNVIANNVVHNIPYFVMPIDYQSTANCVNYVYNNLTYNMESRSILVDSTFGTPINSKNYIWNNTMVSFKTSNCVGAVNRGTGNYGLIQLWNNLCISGSDIRPSLFYADPGLTVNLDSKNNLTWSGTEAKSFGFTLEGKFRPPSSSHEAAGKGINLSDQCAAVGPALCKDLLGVARPLIGNWDVGAYQYPNNASPPSAPGNLRTTIK